MKDLLKLFLGMAVIFGAFYTVEVMVGDNAAKIFQRSIDGYIKNQEEKNCD
jgi:hypothetical protein